MPEQQPQTTVTYVATPAAIKAKAEIIVAGLRNPAFAGLNSELLDRCLNGATWFTSPAADAATEAMKGGRARTLMGDLSTFQRLIPLAAEQQYLTVFRAGTWLTEQLGRPSPHTGEGNAGIPD